MYQNGGYGSLWLAFDLMVASTLVGLINRSSHTSVRGT